MSTKEQLEALIREVVTQESEAALARRPQFLRFFPFLISQIGAKDGVLLPDSVSMVQLLSYLSESRRHNLLLPRGLVETTALLFRLVVLVREPAWARNTQALKDSQQMMLSLFDTIKQKGESELMAVFDGFRQLTVQLSATNGTLPISGACSVTAFEVLGQKATELLTAADERTESGLQTVLPESVTVKLDQVEHIQCLLLGVLPLIVKATQTYHQLWSTECTGFLWQVLRTTARDPVWPPCVRACAFRSLSSLVSCHGLQRGPVVINKVVQTVGAVITERIRSSPSAATCPLVKWATGAQVWIRLRGDG